MLLLTSSFEDIEPCAVNFYSDDLPNVSILDGMHQWKSMWLEISSDDRPQTLTEFLKLCCPDTLPNIYELLKIFSTLPLSSCSCEQSASALHRLNNYRKSTQTEHRLSALALIHFNYETVIDVDYVCKLYITYLWGGLAQLWPIFP